MLELVWLLIPLAAASGWFAAQRSASRRAEQAAMLLPDEYIKGLNFLLNEQPDKALEVFIRIVEVDSDTIETHIVLGNLFRRRGEVDRAIRIHQNIVARPHLNRAHKADALLELGRDYLRAGLLDRAESLLKEVIHIGGQQNQAYRHLREVYEQEKDWANAIEMAIRLQNDCGVPQAEVIAHYYCELGETMIARGQRDHASQYAGKALTYDRNSARASILLGDLAFDNADYNGSIKFYTDVNTQKQEFLPLVLPKLKEAYARQGSESGYLDILQGIRRENRSISVVLSLIESFNARDNRQAVDTIFADELNRPMVPLRIIRELIQVKLKADQADGATLESIARALDSHLGSLASHLCCRCGLETKGLFWQCPSCHGWGTIRPIDHIVVAQKSPFDPKAESPRASAAR